MENRQYDSNRAAGSDLLIDKRTGWRHKQYLAHWVPPEKIGTVVHYPTVMTWRAVESRNKND
jgi:hypothetical protein